MNTNNMCSNTLFPERLRQKQPQEPNRMYMVVYSEIRQSSETLAGRLERTAIIDYTWFTSIKNEHDLRS
jgi:hypothetical protein